VRSLLDQLEAWFREHGWAVVGQRVQGTSQAYTNDHLLTLESRRGPLGVRVEVDLRLYSFADYEWGFEETVLAATVRYPPRLGDPTPAREAHLAGNEVRADDYRQLDRVLTWFRDPLSGVLWEERPLPGDWVPPAQWEAERWGPQVSMDHRWAFCAEPLDMLRYLPGLPADCKLQLIACACCRLLPLEMLHERNRLAVEAVERYAEGLAPRRDMKKACKNSGLAWLRQLEPLPLALHAVRALIENRPADGPRQAADIIRDVLGNPFRPVSLRHGWLRREGGVVRHLADSIAAEERYNELPILADALEDAGCAEAALLEHCRGPGPHVRGCWAVDLLRPRS
jgi:hypothetical protein